MKLRNIIQRATDFGTLRSREHYFSFALKCMCYIIPAVILGNYTDTIVEKIKIDTVFGDYLLNYILLQTIIMITTLYLIVIFLTSYTNEFHFSIAGAFFIVLYFGIQTNYIDMLKEYMN